MATSGTTTFDLDVVDIIEEAYERLGIEARTSYELKSARRSLNLLLQDLSNRQINLWKVIEYTIPLVQGTTVYTLDAAVSDVSLATLNRANIETRMNRLPRNVYEARPNKTTQSRPSQYYVERTNPVRLHIYPAPDNSTDEVKLQAMTRVEDVTAYTETLDIPPRLLQPLISGLTYYLSLKRKPELGPAYMAAYEQELGRALEEDRERTSLKLVPGVRRR